MTSSRFWLGLSPSQLPGTQWLLQPPSEIAALMPVSNPTRPLGWSMTHMLTGMVMSRCFSLGTVGISPVMAKGPNMPLVVQYTCLTCANTADEPNTHRRPSSAATMPFFIWDPPRILRWLVVLDTCTAGSSFHTFRGFVVFSPHDHSGARGTAPAQCARSDSARQCATR